MISDSINRVGGGLAGSQHRRPPGPRAGPQRGARGQQRRGSRDDGDHLRRGAGHHRLRFRVRDGSGPVGKANSINRSRSPAPNIIADDIFYLHEPFFQDGVVAQAVDNARANGVAYFASAGNRARQS